MDVAAQTAPVAPPLTALRQKHLLGIADLSAEEIVLVLDTASDAAERLYERCGWQRVGIIPDFALMPDGARCATVVYYKRLD